MISHDHYDHLDPPTVQRLAREHGTRFFVPVGLREWLALRPRPHPDRRVSAVPTESSKPRKLGRGLQLFEDVSGRLMVPMHWPTFALNREPPDRLMVEALRRGDEERIAVLTPRQTIHWQEPRRYRDRWRR